MKPPPVPNDPGLAAFRQHLAAVARDRVFNELARSVVPQGFFWDRDFAESFDPKKTGVENLAAAIRLEQGAGLGWQMLAEFAAEPTATGTPAAPGVLCAPGRPSFEQEEFDRLLDATSAPRRTGSSRALAVLNCTRRQAPCSRNLAATFCTSAAQIWGRRYDRSVAHGLGSDHDAQRRTRLCCARHLDVTVGAAALLRQGSDRPFAHHRICRRGKLSRRDCEPPHRCRNSRLCGNYCRSVIAP